MTDLEKRCISALRLSEASAEALLEEIKNNIEVAKANLIRLGVTDEKINVGNDALIQNIICKYVVSEMTSYEAERIRALEAYKICLDELRKTKGYVK